MFRITEDPSSGSLEQCLAKNYKNDSVVSVDIDMVGVMAAYLNLMCVCVWFPVYEVPSHTRTHAHTHKHTHNGSQYAAITPTTSMSTDTIESFL